MPRSSALPALLALAAAPARPAAADELFAAHNGIVVIDCATRKPAGEIPLGEVVNGIAFSRDGARAYAGTSGGTDVEKSRGGLYVLDVAARKVLSKPFLDPVKEVRADAGGSRLHLLEWRVRAETKGTRKGRPVKEPFRLRTLDISGPEPRSLGSVAVGMDLYDLAVSPDGKTAYLLDPGHNGLRILDLLTGTLVESASLAGGSKADGTRYEASLAKIVLAPDGARAAVLQDGPSRTGALLLDLDARSRRQVLAAGGSNLRAGRFLPGGKRLLGLTLERLLVLDLEAAKIERTVPLRETFTSLAMSSDGAEVYLGAPAAWKTEGARGKGLVEVRDGESLGLLADVPLPASVKFIQLAPPRRAAER